MSDKKWTKEQKTAINAKGGSLLVSAAAGSGKTAVLVERFISKITDKDHPCDADRLLVVTYTKAAAAELKQRIIKKLDELIVLNPFDLHIKRQQILMEKATISTIHSFCSTLIRENFSSLGISPDYKIADEYETIVIKSDSFDKVLNDFYDNDDAFLNLLDLFSGSRNESEFKDSIFSLYSFLRSLPFPDDWIKNKLSYYDPEKPDFSRWWTIIFDYINDSFENILDAANEALDLIKTEEKINTNYGSFFVSIKEYAGDFLIKSANLSMDDTIDFIKNINPAPIKALRNYENIALKNKAAELKSKIESNIKSINKILTFNMDDCINDLEFLYPVVKKLFEFIKAFDSDFYNAKLSKNILDFSDLEMLTIKLLISQNNNTYSPSLLAKEISQNFDEILIDEYQDINEAQEMIFKAISQNESNLFMVGDVKQSIYRFRQACPQLFIDKKNSYALYNGSVFPAKIILGKNFRSRDSITDSVNFVFSRIMSSEKGEILYDKENYLVCGSNYPENDDSGFSLNLIDIKNLSKDDDKELIEARFIANQIKDMINNKVQVFENGTLRNCEYKDFCILMQTIKGRDEKYMHELQKADIPCVTEKLGGFFSLYEISVLLSYLRIIDNPNQDIPLLSVLLSPVWGFTADDLSEIRLTDTSCSFYSALLKARNEGNIKALNFLTNLNKLQNIAPLISVNILLNKILEETSFLSIISSFDNDDFIANNIHLLQCYAKDYEEKSANGLSGFINFIDRLIEQKQDLSLNSPSASSANVVKIMSIHKSKGLEFSFCILTSCDHNFNMKPFEVNLLTDNTLGLGFNRKINDGILKISTLPMEAVKLKLKKSAVSEHMRLLYVAMTRAKERFICNVLSSDINSDLKKSALIINKDLSFSFPALISSKNFSTWLLACALLHPDGKNLRALADFYNSNSSSAKWNISIVDAEDFMDENKPNTYDENNFIEDAPIDENIISQLSKTINYKYLYDYVNQIPLKLTATDLLSAKNDFNNIILSRPSFIFKKGLTKAEIGTAIHNFMQYCDFYKANNNFNDELNRLVQQEFISKEQAAVINEATVKNFLDSKLGQRILSSSKIIKEKRFTVNSYAGEIFPGTPDQFNEEKIILQGSVDLIFEENNSYVIVDYKTNYIKNICDLKKIYAAQLNLYKNAIEKCTEKNVSECLIYSFHLNEYISID